MESKKQKIIDRKIKNLWIIEMVVLNQMKYQKSATNEELAMKIK